MKVWVLVNTINESFVSVHQTKKGAEEFKEEVRVWSRLNKLDLRIKEVDLKK